MAVKDLGSKNERMLVFGGPYSNLQATEKVKKIAKEEGISSDNVICTGDSIAYCGAPEKTAMLVREWRVHIILGNVEEQLKADSESCNCNFDKGSECDILALQWYPFAKSCVSKETLEWLETIPKNITFEMNGKKVFVLHGGIQNISQYIFKSTPWKVKQEFFDETKADIILGGHAGIPFSDSKDGKLWVNAGVVGMPANDGTPRVWYCIVEPKDGGSIEFEHKSFEYENGLAVFDMEKNSLPDKYAKTLKNGLWPNCDVLPEKETSEQGKELRFEKVVFR